MNTLLLRLLRLLTGDDGRRYVVAIESSLIFGEPMLMGPYTLRGACRRARAVQVALRGRQFVDVVPLPAGQLADEMVRTQDERRN